ncbi:glycosyl transferase family 2 [Thermaurantimonas aggregans]|uniref:Glycosyl transferase family 2 n=1 Tax=Thermaurantimonas aggregans TaxID=2173829 RepID=A0A401XMS2_9FLAO|nr:glycosyltransferase family 2 protein [Thermaurantimonas aggregans]MCX8149386.1 glycosyltransferase family 2 protein [Thermaurantimonas aggregans]GCD78319.1 glycosyl transferase family 2 [Thermaurantimonas aggregans]
MDVAIAILNYNGLRHLQQFLPDMILHSSGHRIVVIDNASTDESVQWLKAYYPEVEIVPLDSNYGFAGGYNRGLSQVNADVYLLINSDVKVTPGWTKPLIELLQSNLQIAAVQPKIKALLQPDYFEYAGAAGGYVDWLGYPFCRGRIFETLEKDCGQYDDTRQVFWTSGACMAIRAEAFWQAGGFDEAFFAHQEEIDLCWRLQRLGYVLYVEPKSVVYHLGGGTLDYQSPRKTFLNFRNNLMMLAKNMSMAQVLVVIPLRLLLDGVAGIRFLVSGKSALTWQIVRAHFSFYGHFSRLAKERKNFRVKNPKTHSVKLFRKTILVEYFLKGRRFFKDYGL